MSPHQDIDEITHMLNQCNKNVTFQCEAIIVGVLLNPGPKDTNVDNILQDILQHEDCSM